MPKLDKKSKIALLKIVEGDGLEILTDIANHMLAMKAQGTMERETAFLTAAEALKREARKSFIRDFLQVLERLAHTDNNHDSR